MNQKNESNALTVLKKQKELANKEQREESVSYIGKGFSPCLIREKPMLRSDFLGREACVFYKSRPIHFRLC